VEPSTPRARRDPSLTFVRASAATVTIIGSVVLVAGWGFHVSWVRTPIPGSVSMKPNAALCFVLAGATLWSISDERRHPRTPVRVMARVAPALIATIGALTLIEYLLGRGLWIDGALFRDTTVSVGTATPGRMAPVTALCFLSLGSSMLLLDRRDGPALAQWLAVFGLFVGYPAVLAYFLGPIKDRLAKAMRES